MKSAFITALWLEATAAVSFWLCDLAFFQFRDRLPGPLDVRTPFIGQTVAAISLFVSLACTALVLYRLIRRGLPGARFRSPEGQPVRRHRLWIALWLVLLTPCAGTVIGVGVLLDLFTFPSSAGPFQRAQFQAIVEQVRRQKGDPTEVRKYTLDDLAHPDSLRPVGNVPMRGNRDVFAQATSDGNLRVVIVTVQMGHAGAWGFAYSDVPLAPEQVNGMTVIDVPGPVREVRADGKIDDHWWRVYDDLE